MKRFNDIAAEMNVHHLQVNAHAAESRDVEFLVRALENRSPAPDLLARLRVVAKEWEQYGGEFTAPVLTEDLLTPALLPKHRVLLPTFELKAKAFMLTYNSADVAEGWWTEFKTFMVALHKKHGARAWGACLETSLHAQDPGRYHLHAYLLWTDGVGMRTRSTEPFHFKGVRPRIDVCRSRTATTSPYAAACHGLWYVVVHKAGTIHSDTNYPAGVWYKPKATWLQSLYQDKKMDHDAYLAMSARDFAVGHSARKRDAEEAFRDARKHAVSCLVRAELQGLRAVGAYKDRKQFQQVNQFLACFDDTYRWRRPLLLITGGTNLGKSMLGGKVLEELAERSGIECYAGEGNPGGGG